MNRALAISGFLLMQIHILTAEDSVVPDGYVRIFDGTLKDWDGDPVYWKAENGILAGEVRPETLLKRNSFIIWRGGETGDFELKLEYRNIFLKQLN